MRQIQTSVCYVDVCTISDIYWKKLGLINNCKELQL